MARTSRILTPQSPTPQSPKRSKRATLGQNGRREHPKSTMRIPESNFPFWPSFGRVLIGTPHTVNGPGVNFHENCTHPSIRLNCAPVSNRYNHHLVDWTSECRRGAPQNEPNGQPWAKMNAANSEICTMRIPESNFPFRPSFGRV